MGLSWGDLVLPQSVTFSYCCTFCPRLEVCCTGLEQGCKKLLDRGILLTSGGPFPYPLPGARICFLISFAGESSAGQGQTKVLFSNWLYRAPWVQPDSGEEAEVFLVLGGVSASSGPLVPPSHWFALATVAVWSLLPLIQLGTGAHPVLDDPVRRQTGYVSRQQQWNGNIEKVIFNFFICCLKKDTLK